APPARRRRSPGARPARRPPRAAPRRSGARPRSPIPSVCVAAPRTRTLSSMAVQTTPGILARGPWSIDEVRARWSEEPFEPDADKVRAADAAIRALRDRGSPSHDGVAARLVTYSQPTEGGLVIDLQPVRWALRLVDGDASDSVAALC